MVRKALKEIKVIRESKALKDSQGLMGRKVRRATREIKVILVQQAPPVHKVQLELKVYQDRQAQREPGGLKVSPVLMARRGREGPRVNKVRRGPVDR